MISDKRRDQALTYLAETDEELAYAGAHVARCEFKAKQIKQTVFLLQTGSVADRTAHAETSQEYADAMENYFEAMRHRDHLRMKRKTEEIVWETWRSQNSARTKGLPV